MNIDALLADSYQLILYQNGPETGCQTSRQTGSAIGLISIIRLSLLASELLLPVVRGESMKTAVVWKDAMEFSGLVDSHIVPMDAKSPIGKDKAASPKELVAMGLGGCTAMDVIALLKKHKQPPKTFRVDIEIQPSTGAHPIVFNKATLSFIVDGDVEAEILVEAVKLSQTKYCGVSAMLAKSFPIEYRVILNGQEVGTGLANFDSQKTELT